MLVTARVLFTKEIISSVLQMKRESNSVAFHAVKTYGVITKNSYPQP
jgi:hypothetical protein